MDLITKIEGWDQQLILLINGFNYPVLDQIMWVVSDPLFGIPFYLLFIYLIAKKYSMKSTVIIVLMLGAVVGLGDFIAHELFKETIQRFRPSHHFDLKNQLHFHVSEDGSLYRGGKYGFISNHATNMAALCFGVFLILKTYYNWAWFYLLTFVLLISYSRMYLGVHYFSDIIGGWLIGLILAYLGFIMVKKIITI